LTASGECAQVGVTIAVDPNVIPFRGTVDIETVGSRRALDTGGAIRGYHIDVYNGIGRSVCADWQNENLTVTFLNY
jgi:3D (Asp-Asp-Asp) domain-containing protein